MLWSFTLFTFSEAIAGTLDLQGGEKSFLRNFHLADLFHALLAFFLPLQELALAGDIAAVALRRDVFAERLDRLARDHPAADGRLDHHFEELPRNQLAHLLHEIAAAVICFFSMHDHRHRVDDIAV